MDGPKDLYRYGQNTQFSHYKVRGTQNTYSFTETQYFFLKKKCENTFLSMYIKAECMKKFDIFHTHVENSVNSVICFFWALLQAAKIWNLSSPGVLLEPPPPSTL
jgi:hypothetical protein